MNMNKKKETPKNSIKIKQTIEKQEDLNKFINEKIVYLQEIIRKTILSIKKNKQNDIFSNNDTNLSITVLTDLYQKTTEINKLFITSNNKDTDVLIELLQKVIDKLSMIICGFGTQHIDDLLFISFGSEYKNIKIDNPIIKEKYELIREYVQPVGYKIIHWKQSKTTHSTSDLLCNNKITDDVVSFEDANMFECFDTEINAKSFYQRIYGIRVIIQNEKLKKTLIINGLVKDIHLE